MELAKEKNVKLLCVKAGDKLKIDGITISILHPTKNLITENSANNNSIVCKLEYNSFSMLFTGDIEEIAEKEILNNYKNDLSVLKATVLKVGHHGSKTSSTEEFIKAVSPKVALIGVGKNNNFGHPNENVIQRIEQLGTKVYRTDINGEISITVNHKGKIKNIENHIQDIVTIHG